MLYERIFRAFNAAGLQYAVIGGIAVNLHGFIRATSDLDIVVLLDDAQLRKFVNVTKTLGLVPRLPVRIEDLADEKSRREWIEQKNMLVFSVYNPKDPLEHIDLMIDHPEMHGKIIQNSVRMEADGVAVQVACIDDLIELKKLAGRDRDDADIKALEKLRDWQVRKK